MKIAGHDDVPYCNIVVEQKCPLCKKERKMMFFTSFYTYKDMENGKLTARQALDKTLKEKPNDIVMVEFYKSGTCFKCQKKRYGRKLSNETKFCIVN